MDVVMRLELEHVMGEMFKGVDAHLPGVVPRTVSG